MRTSLPSLLVVERDRRAAVAIVGREERRVRHLERIEHALLEELIERQARRDFDDAAEGFDAGQRAVAPARAGLEVERHRPSVGMYFCEGAASVLRGAMRAPMRDAGAAALQSRGVRQQIADRDLAVGGHRVDLGLARGLSVGRGRPRRRLHDRHLACP